MGLYINQLSNGMPLPPQGKADLILSDFTRELTPEEARTYQPFMVCVVSNAQFDAAAFIYNREELAAFHHPDSGRQRPRRWFVAEKTIRANFPDNVIYDHLQDYQQNKDQEIPGIFTEPREQYEARMKKMFGNNIAIIHLEDYE